MNHTLVEVASLVVALASIAGALGIWGICAVLQKGFNEHIKAMQAIYESTRRPRD